MFDIILSININDESLYVLFVSFVCSNIETFYLSMKRKEKEERRKKRHPVCVVHPGELIK